jgi:lycopene cyclase domain-containing protein
MPIYPALALAAGVFVTVLELRVFRSGVLRTRAFWASMVIVLAFMVAVDGWLTKLTAPIVLYDDAQTSGIRPIWDILIEEYAYAYALLTMVVLLWDRAARREARR